MTSPQQQQASLPLRYKEWRDGLTAVAMFPTLTLLPFVHEKVGFDLLTPGSIIAMTALLLLLQSCENFHLAVPMLGRIGAAYPSEALRNFAFVFLIRALWERRKRWKEILRGEGVHTYSHGVSWLEGLPLRQDLIYRIADPLACWTVGALLRKIGIGGLGLWVEFSAFCFYLVANYAHDRALERDLGLFNSDLESKAAAETAAFFEGKAEGTAKARSLKDTYGISTGADAGLEAIIRRRKAAGVSRDA